MSCWAEGLLPVILDVSLTTCFSWLFSQHLKALLCSTLSIKEEKCSLCFKSETDSRMLWFVA